MKTSIKRLATYGKFDSAYWGLGSDSQNVYFGLCSHYPGGNAGLFSCNLDSGNIEKILTLDEVTNSFQGKIHTPIVTAESGQIFFGTHFAYPYGDPQNLVEYEGGHVVAYNPKNRTIIDFGVICKGEGILTIALDKQRHRIYALTVPSGHLFMLDILRKSYKKIGTIPSQGSICRTITIDKRGRTFGSFENNGLFIYDPFSEDLILKHNFFPDEKTKEWSAASRGGVNKVGRKLWRCASYDQDSDEIYGIYAASSRVFKIKCENLELNSYDQLLPLEFKQDVYPTLSLVTDDNNLFYAPADGMFDYCRSEGIEKNTHLMIFNKSTHAFKDLGEIADKDYTVFGIGGAISKNGELFMLGACRKISSHTATTDILHQMNGNDFDLCLIRVTELSMLERRP